MAVGKEKGPLTWSPNFIGEAKNAKKIIFYFVSSPLDCFLAFNISRI